MKTGFFTVFFMFLAVLLGACGAPNTQPIVSPTADHTPTAVVSATPQPIPDPLNLTFEIEGSPVTLVDGVSEVEAAPGSAAKIVTRAFGVPVYGDLNDDGREDVALLLTQEGGGSGTFYYAAAALQTDAGFTGANAVLLGDRIAPYSLVISDGQVLATYADRKPGEPFSAPPTVETVKTLRVEDDQLLEVNDPA